MQRGPIPFIGAPVAFIALIVLLAPAREVQAPRLSVPATSSIRVAAPPRTKARAAPTLSPCLSARTVPGDPLATFFRNFQRDRDRALLTTDIACLKAVTEGPELNNLIGTVNALRATGERLLVRVTSFRIDSAHAVSSGVITVATTVGETRTSISASGARLGSAVHDLRTVIYRLRSVADAPPGGGWMVQDEAASKLIVPTPTLCRSGMHCT